MQADLREILAWHAKRCAAALVGSVYKVRMCYLLFAHAINTYEECNLGKEEPWVKALYLSKFGSQCVFPSTCTVVALQGGLHWCRRLKYIQTTILLYCAGLPLNTVVLGRLATACSAWNMYSVLVLLRFINTSSNHYFSAHITC